MNPHVVRAALELSRLVKGLSEAEVADVFAILERHFEAAIAEARSGG